MTQRAEILISTKISANIEHLQRQVVSDLKDSNQIELDAKFHLWNEENCDTNRKNGKRAF